MGGDWAHLPEDLLIDIGKRIKCVEDQFAFSAVCLSWRGVSSSVKLNYAPSVPWLMIPECSVHRSSSNMALFNPSTNKHCTVDLLETFGKNCWYCRDGWIFMVGFDMKIFLYNPLTRVQIGLPSIGTLPMMEYEGSDDGMEADAGDSHDRSEDELAMMEVDSGPYIGHNEKELARWSLIRSTILVKIPPEDGFLVLVTSDLYHLAFARPRDAAWSVVDYDNGRFGVHTAVKDDSVEDIIAFNGHILLLFGDGKLVGSSIDRLLLSKGEDFTAEEYVHGDIHGPLSRFSRHLLEYFYLVESDGDLLVVLRFTESYELIAVPEGEEEEEELQEAEQQENEQVYYIGGVGGGGEEESFRIIGFQTKAFEVYKYDSGTRDWVRVENLGDVSLFVGGHSAASVCASKANCKPNCIYYTDEKPDPTKSKFTGYDMGIFDLQTSDFEQLDYHNDSTPRFSSPFWYMPKFV